MLIVEPGFVLCGYGGERSEKEGAEQVRDWFRVEGWEAHAGFLLTSCISTYRSASSTRSSAVAQDAHELEFLDLLKSKGYEILPVSYS